MKKPTPAQLAARAKFAEMVRSGAFKKKKRKTAKKNPAKKTVNQKISQLRNEGYPQKQAVAVALSEMRAGKVKKNPIVLISDAPKRKASAKKNPTTFIHDKPKRKTNPKSRVKTRNLAKGIATNKIGYAVHLADRPYYHALGWFTKRSDAVEVAQEASDRTGKQLAVTRAQIHFA